ncbi:MAG: COX15/CtaA family protein [Candidatus Thiodiazotropha sp.]
MLIGQFRLSLLTALLAFCVILVGAYVRLSDAGLGCPDWPGCYGQMVVPDALPASHPDDPSQTRPLHRGKAWKEMIHRYLAGTLGLMILLLAVLAWRNRADPDQPRLLPGLLLGLVTLQAALGMWTVTLLVKPAIVTAHLLGGFATFVLLVLLALRLRQTPLLAPQGQSSGQSPGLRRHARIALLVLILQITLGGWTSTNYAALGCTDFPQCHAGQWWPQTDFSEAFTLWRGLGINYEFGVLEHDARAAIHLTHRIGALLTLLVVGSLGLRLWRQPAPGLRRLGGLALLLLTLQIVLGISNVLAQLPLPVAVAHNGVAALLLLSLTLLNRRESHHEA